MPVKQQPKLFIASFVALASSAVGATVSGLITAAWVHAARPGTLAFYWMEDVLVYVFAGLFFAMPLALVPTLCISIPPFLLMWLPLWLLRDRVPVFWKWLIAPFVGGAFTFMYWVVSNRIHPYFSPNNVHNEMIPASYVGSAVGGICMFATGCAWIHPRDIWSLKWVRKTTLAALVAIPLTCAIWIYLGNQHAVRHYDVSFTVSLGEKFKGLPGGRVWHSKRGTDHQIWGSLRVDITLPDGKRIRGSSKRLSVLETEKGIAAIQLFYVPDSLPDDVYYYWAEGGIFLSKYEKLPDRNIPPEERSPIFVNRPKYSLDLSTYKGKEERDVSYCLDIKFPAVQP